MKRKPCSCGHPPYGKKCQAIARLDVSGFRIRAALKSHECPGDGSTDQWCYARIMAGKKCTITEALE